MRISNVIDLKMTVKVLTVKHMKTAFFLLSIIVAENKVK